MQESDKSETKYYHVKYDAILCKLKKYIEREKFKGYDPIDIFNSFLPLKLFPPIVKVIFSQIHLRNPINIRPLLGIKKDYNPGALGVLLEAYSILYSLSKEDNILEKMYFLFDNLIYLSSKGYKSYCWGLNLIWAGLDNIVPKNCPNIVTTSLVAKGIFEFYKATKERKAIDILDGIEAFILNDIPIIETSYGKCFSYTNLKKEACYNANMLAAEILTKIYSLSNNEKDLKLAEKAVEFTVAHQQKDGHWNYSINLAYGIERQQIDFHQGYILMSLYDFLKYSGKEYSYMEHLIKGIEYYKEKQFFKNGRAKWRLPKVFPIETHHHAIGICTFAKLSDVGEPGNGYLDFALKIADWTIDNLLDSDGYFYFRMYKKYKNKISYLRVTQSFMMLALTMLKLKLN